MATRNPQTMAKRAREQAVKERRERKQEKKRAAAVAKAAGPPDDGLEQPPLENDARDGELASRVGQP